MEKRSCNSCRKPEDEVKAMVAFQSGFARGQLQHLYICNECVEEAVIAIAYKDSEWRDHRIEALNKMKSAG
ncbi:MAG: hypothetical protein JWQ87_2414 [Candidatus Sulfotelmatobacter sp.]|nr:hypothetical protein [Candidatus Sulfotelmatobacter sp.]